MGLSLRHRLADSLDISSTACSSPFTQLPWQKRKTARFLLWIGVSYVLTSNYIVALNGLAATPFNVMQSYTLVEAVVLPHTPLPLSARQCSCCAAATHLFLV